MQQLSRHWAHKFPVKLDEGQSYIELPNALCPMFATGESLRIELDVQSGDDFSHVEHIVQVHLERFAHQETLVVKWDRF